MRYQPASPCGDFLGHRKPRLRLRPAAQARPTMVSDLLQTGAVACPLPCSADGILAAQTSTLIGAESGIKTIAAVHSQCRCWVIIGQTITGQNPPLSALVQKRTNAGATGLSALCQSRPVQRSKQHHYSITSSAMLSRPEDRVIPSAFAVFRLITNSNLVGFWTGRSAGLSPLRMRSIYPPARRNASTRLSP
jgi:hypothetical protein